MAQRAEYQGARAVAGNRIGRGRAEVGSVVERFGARYVQVISDTEVQREGPAHLEIVLEKSRIVTTEPAGVVRLHYEVGVAHGAEQKTAESVAARARQSLAGSGLCSRIV